MSSFRIWDGSMQVLPRCPGKHIFKYQVDDKSEIHCSWDKPLSFHERNLGSNTVVWLSTSIDSWLIMARGYNLISVSWRTVYTRTYQIKLTYNDRVLTNEVDTYHSEDLLIQVFTVIITYSCRWLMVILVEFIADIYTDYWTTWVAAFVFRFNEAIIQ